MTGAKYIFFVIGLLVYAQCAQRTSGNTTKNTTQPPPQNINSNTQNGNNKTPPPIPRPIVSTRFVGRFDFSNPNAPRFGWPASTIITSFKGTQLDANMIQTENNYHSIYDVFVDGNTIPTAITLDNSQTIYTLAQNLTDANHVVKLVKRTESVVGIDQFLGFILPDTHAQWLQVPAAPIRQIEFIGDSITAGYGDLADLNATEVNVVKFSPETESVDATYAALTAQAFGADFMDIAYSGRGMYMNNDNTTIGTMPMIYPLILADNNTLMWQHPSSWNPQIVVLNLGTNDFFGNNPNTLQFTTHFQSTYLNFVKTLRSIYPDAVIFCAIGPIMLDPHLTTIRGIVQNIVGIMHEAGDPNVLFFEFAQDTGANGYGVDYHPDFITQAQMALALQANITQALGW